MPISPSSLDSASRTQRNDEEETILRQLGLGNSSASDEIEIDSPSSLFADESDRFASSGPLHPALTFGLVCGLTINIGMLMSLPMVLMNRGAPYVPTFSKRAHVMFQQLRRFNKTKRIPKQTLVGLGSGDGRLVAHAASEGYKLAIGYELNPALHILANMRRFTSWQLISKTRFYWKDLWKVSLHDADVVVVVGASNYGWHTQNSHCHPMQYGWGSIMPELQNKLQEELRPGSIVVSNVFALPQWKPSSVVDNVYLYITPACFDKDSGKGVTA